MHIKLNDKSVAVGREKMKEGNVYSSMLQS